jgi:hypothetical protein
MPDLVPIHLQLGAGLGRAPAVSRSSESSSLSTTVPGLSDQDAPWQAPMSSGLRNPCATCLQMPEVDSASLKSGSPSGHRSWAPPGDFPPREVRGLSQPS